MSEEVNTDKVFPILLVQQTRLLCLYCYECGLKFQSTQCVTIKLHQIPCPGCMKTGFVLWQRGQR